nr:uncharacterized protein LOC120964789 [Aegilops tauschii subsp. strangulata]
MRALTIAAARFGPRSGCSLPLRAASPAAAALALLPRAASKLVARVVPLPRALAAPGLALLAAAPPGHRDRAPPGVSPRALAPVLWPAAALLLLHGGPARRSPLASPPPVVALVPRCANPRHGHGDAPPRAGATGARRPCPLPTLPPPFAVQDAGLPVGRYGNLPLVPEHEVIQVV